MKYLIILIILLTIFAGPTFADTIVLKNGRAIDGIITGEAEDTIILNVGGGTITLPRIDIETISISDPSINTQMQEAWEEQYIENFPAPTEQDQDILDGFKKMLHLKKELTKGLKRKDSITRDITLAKRAITELENGQNVINKKLKEANAKAKNRQETMRYNTLVAELNLVTNNIKASYKRLEEYYSTLGEVNKSVEEYINLFLSFKSKVNTRIDKLVSEAGMSAEQKDFYNNLTSRLDTLERGIVHDEIECMRKGNNLLVNVILNGILQTPLIVDTGAELTLISDSIASKIGIDFDSLENEIILIMADGSKVFAKSVVLKSIKVGNEEAKDVRAAVMKSDAVKIQYGLLGMSFLKNFSFSINLEKSKITFSSVKN